MSAPADFANWLAEHEHIDPKYGHVYKYHSRSDAHSIALCTLIVSDILEQCPLLREHAAQGEIAYGINVRHTWPNGKHKTIDLAFGKPKVVHPDRSAMVGVKKAVEFADVLISCEAKTVMTEHKKSQPRVFDELSSSHEIVHQGKADAIAAGITVVNISETFVSPLRQRGPGSPVATRHRQPQVTESMVKHLRGLPVRDRVAQVGFDAYCTFVITCDNITTATLWTDVPAPRPGDPDHYDTFISRISHFYTERFRVLT